jgi:hypothetical protein
VGHETFRDHLATVITDEDFDAALRSVRFSRDPSVPDWLYEYEEDELAIGVRAYEKNHANDAVDIMSFFPELKLAAPFCDRLPSVPVWLMLPYYNQIIVWLEPYRSADTFERTYGLPPEALTDLCGTPREPGKIVPILNAPPQAFAGIPHFERILALRPPTMWRDFFFQRALIGARGFSEARREALEIISRKLGSRTRYASLRGTSRGTVRDLAVSCYCEVCSFGGQDLARRVVQDTSTPVQMVDLLFYYSLMLYDSLVSPLGGNYACTREQLSNLVCEVGSPTTSNLEQFPVEIGRNLIDELHMPLPTDPRIRDWWVTDARDIWKPARKALKDLDTAINNQSSGRLTKGTTQFESIWNDVAAEVRSSRAISNRLKWVLSGVGVMGLLGGLALPGFPGIVASLAGTAMTLSVFDVQAIYSRVSRPRHLVSLLDLYDYLHQHPYFACS